jgi:hypothetical protein
MTSIKNEILFSSSNKIHQEVGRAKDLSAPLYKSLARPENKQTTVTGAFDVHRSYLLSYLEEYYYCLYI